MPDTKTLEDYFAELPVVDVIGDDDVIVLQSASGAVLGRMTIAELAAHIGAASVAPSITGIPTIDDTSPVAGDTLTATPATVAGTPAPARTWQWYDNGVAISGATSATYTASEGEVLTVRQTETNASGSATATSAATDEVTALPVAPVITTAPEWVDGSLAQVGEPMAFTAAVATGTPAPTAAYSLVRDGTPVAGAITSPYTPVEADEGVGIQVRATASNGVGSPAISDSVASDDVLEEAANELVYHLLGDSLMNGANAGSLYDDIAGVDYQQAVPAAQYAKGTGGSSGQVFSNLNYTAATAGTGPAVSMGRGLIARGVPNPYLLERSSSGSGVTGSGGWEEDGTIYDNMIAQATAALATLTDPLIRATCVDLGTNDANNETEADEYAADIASFKARYKAAFSALLHPDWKMVLARPNPTVQTSGAFPELGTIRDAITDLAASDSEVIYIDQDLLDDLGDNVHWDEFGVIGTGYAFARAAIRGTNQISYPGIDEGAPYIDGVPTITVSNDPPQVGDLATVNFAPTFGGPAPTNSAQWQLDGVDEGAPSTTYSIQEADIGDVLRVGQTASNGTSPNAGPVYSAGLAAIVAADPPGWTLADLANLRGLYLPTTGNYTEIGGALSQIDDQSGNGHHLTQSTAASRPTRETGAILNGRPYMLFDGVDDFLLNSTYNHGDADQLTWVIIGQLLTNVNGRYICAYEGLGLAPRLTQATTSRLLFTGRSGGGSIVTVGTDTTQALTASWDNEDDNSDGTVNGTQMWLGDVSSHTASGGASATMALTGRMSLGGAFDGATPSHLAIAAFAQVAGIPTPTELANIESYAVSEFGFTAP